MIRHASSALDDVAEGAEGRTAEVAEADTSPQGTAQGAEETASGADDAAEEDIYATVDKKRVYTSEDDQFKIYPDETPEAREERLARNARNVKSDPLLGQDLPPADEPAPPVPVQTEDSVVDEFGERLVPEESANNVEDSLRSRSSSTASDYEDFDSVRGEVGSRKCEIEIVEHSIRL